MPAARHIRAALVLIALAGCGAVPDAPPQPETLREAAPPPPAQITAAPSPKARPDRATQDPLRAYYQSVEQRLLAMGQLRRDPGTQRIPPHILARNFADIALRDEYALEGGRLRARSREVRLRRWAEAPRWSVTYGSGLAAERQPGITSEIRRYMARLSRLTGMAMRESALPEAEIRIFFLTEAELRNAAPQLRAIAPLDNATLTALTELNRDTYCAAVALSKPFRHIYQRAIIIIRAEHPALFRSACIHEELAQAMGLANDSPTAQPSIFNDNEEYALLTHHDELLLRMLYDPRLKPGMVRAEAEPIALQIADELLGAGT